MANSGASTHSQPLRMKIYFSDFFDISPQEIEDYGAFNVSLVNDLPLFIDPFLLFRSKKPEYQRLHAGIIDYMCFLRDQSLKYQGKMPPGLLAHWYLFKEVKQNWLGFSRVGNKGSALGKQFAEGLDEGLYTLFSDFGDASQRITAGRHIEKVCLVSDGVGRDNLSDFTTNLIKEYLLEYTQAFALASIRPAFRRRVAVQRVKFDYAAKQWVPATYELPYFRHDYVLLTPKDILTKDDMWINRTDLFDEYEDIAAAIPDDQLRAQVDAYFRSVLPVRPKKSQVNEAIRLVVKRFPKMLDYYIRSKEEHGDEAVASSLEQVAETEQLFVDQVRDFVDRELTGTNFYDRKENTLENARARAIFLKDVIENRGGYRVFYLRDRPIRKETELQVLHRLVWRAETPEEATQDQAEGQRSSLVEFKLASNTQLLKTFEHHAEAVKENDRSKLKVSVIICFSDADIQRARGYLRDFTLTTSRDIILMDARPRKQSAALIRGC